MRQRISANIQTPTTGPSVTKDPEHLTSDLSDAMDQFLLHCTTLQLFNFIVPQQSYWFLKSQTASTRWQSLLLRLHISGRHTSTWLLAGLTSTDASLLDFIGQGRGSNSNARHETNERILIQAGFAGVSLTEHGFQHSIFTGTV